MASIVRHRTGSWEIRESVRTPLGPRSRTLATFRTLTPAVLAHAANRASRPFDAAAVTGAAKRKGVPVAAPAERDAALRLIDVLAAGETLPSGLRATLREALGESTDSDTDATGRQRSVPHVLAVVPWARATLQARGEALVDLLLLADALPAPPPRTERFPRLRSAAASTAELHPQTA
ncbi:MAG: hypothetical protein QM679_07395 [Patulibacter sp.]